MCSENPTITELIDYDQFCGIPQAAEAEAAELPVPEISVEELKRKQDAGEKFVLLDVREPYEYDISRIPGSKLIPLGELHYFAHWITPERAPRRYDTRFFVGRAPDDHPLRHDGDETIAALWARPSDALARNAAGDFELIRPTQHSLEILSDYPDADAVLAAAAARPLGMETFS